jgi:hypothetical protein
VYSWANRSIEVAALARDVGQQRVAAATGRDQARARALAEHAVVRREPLVQGEHLLPGHDQRECPRLAAAGQQPPGDVDGEQAGHARVVGHRERRRALQTEPRHQVVHRVDRVGHHDRHTARVDHVPHEVLAAPQRRQCPRGAFEQVGQRLAGPLPAHLAEPVEPAQHADLGRGEPQLGAHLLERHPALGQERGDVGQGRPGGGPGRGHGPGHGCGRGHDTVTGSDS